MNCPGFTTRGFVEVLNFGAPAAIVLCGEVQFHGSIPTGWQIDAVGDLPPADQRDELLDLLPDCRVRKDGEQ
ncbi:MAG TPA: hypothetical protein VMY42_08680 [Thermoguttaceae bacterium]|nr:hypothetical protein [Thermoguttaceae bacterium]